MRPRRVAPIIALIGLILMMGRTMHELPQRYRVQIDVPPVDAALWFAARYPQYFTSGEAELEPWLEGLPARDRVFVQAMAQTLAWTWVEHELSKFTATDPNGIARETTVVVRHKTLNQLEINYEHYADLQDVELNAYIRDPLFSDGVFARLVRGVSNCEGQNHLAALLLESALEDTITIDVEMLGVPSHDMVRLRGPGLAQPLYVDAWSNLPAFTIDPSAPGDAPLLSELGDPPPPVVPGAASQPPFPVSSYEEGSPSTVYLLPERDAPTIPVSLEIRAPKLDEASLARINDPWRIYLYARILHVYDDPRAADLYRFLRERHCKDQRPGRTTFVCDAANLLAERLD
jgi:hypothetical protein